MLAAAFRLLVGLKSLLEKHTVDFESKRQYILNVRKRPSNACKGGEEGIVVVRRNVKRTRSWQMTIDGPRAAIDTLIIGILYLLMLSLMTMNTGYCISIVSGTVLGNLAVRRYSGESLSRRAIGFTFAVVAIVVAGDLY